jgi:hypothetical protein
MIYAKLNRVEDVKGNVYDIYEDSTIELGGEQKTILNHLGVYSKAGLVERKTKATKSIEQWDAIMAAIDRVESK